LEEGDRAAALEAIENALEIDPDFLAAQCLRDRIQLSESSASRVPLAPRESQQPHGLSRISSFTANSRFGGEAHANRLWRDALLPAAAVFGAIVLGSSWLGTSNVLTSRSSVSIATLVELPEQPPGPETTASFGTGVNAAVPTASAEDMQSTGGEPGLAASKESVGRELQRVRAIIAAETLAARTGEDAGAAEPAPPPAPPLPDPVVPASAGLSPGPANDSPGAVPVPTALASADDEILIQKVLQRYRSAYQVLDARSAREVWPAVNQAALSRAFNGLESQTLSFDECYVRVRGTAGGATCHGTASYVPRVGSRDARVEPRTWTFVLRKIGADWIIQSVKTDPREG
jgi:hypothetical protein